MNNLETESLASKERQFSLEEFCVYGEADDENVDKIRALGAAKHAAKSLASTESAIAIRALIFCSLVCRNDEKSC